jgi:processive 1,2-diacylglycerol beta-glucosyltransferase
MKNMIAPNPADTRPRVHVVYEYGIDLRPHSSTYLRLIRPLSHPRVQTHINTTFYSDYSGTPADIVIVDRFWRPDVSLEAVQELLEKIRLQKAKFIYSLDDNFFDLAQENRGWPSPSYIAIADFMLRHANGVLVSTPALRDRLLEYNRNIFVLPNQLDERILVIRHPSEIRPVANRSRIVVGYMGTLTHDEDLLLVAPALKAIMQRYPQQLQFQVCGGISKAETKKELIDLPVRDIGPLPEENEYPMFMLWFTGQVHWDIAISPLRSSAFNNCKSDIKFLDYSAIGCAGIYSQSPAYAATIKHKENGWITENTPEAWEDALETLIEDISLRTKIAQQATRYLYSERILAQRWSNWVNAIEAMCSL